MWAPNINRDYKDGEDIRPLKPTGVQNQRFAQLKYEEEEAKNKGSLRYHLQKERSGFCALDLLL
jgi:hypothetical protein